MCMERPEAERRSHYALDDGAGSIKFGIRVQ